MDYQTQNKLEAQEKIKALQKIQDAENYQLQVRTEGSNKKKAKSR